MRTNTEPEAHTGKKPHTTEYTPTHTGANTHAHEQTKEVSTRQDKSKDGHIYARRHTEHKGAHKDARNEMHTSTNKAVAP